MKFFIDTANIEEIGEAHDMGILDGVTTNPSLMAKEGIADGQAIRDHYAKIAALVEGDVSAEVLSLDYKDMVVEGESLAEIAPNIVVKVPMTLDGVKAIRTLTDRGIRTNCTLIFSSAQAILAAKAGASYMSPFIGRVDDINWDGMSLIRDIAEIYAIQMYDTEILAASIRSSSHIVDAARSGADIVTCPLKSIKGLFNHPLTDIGLAKFLADHKRVAGS